MAHLSMQKTNGARLGIVRAERIRAHQFGELPGLVGIGGADGPHLVQYHSHAAARELPGGL